MKAALFAVALLSTGCASQGLAVTGTFAGSPAPPVSTTAGDLGTASPAAPAATGGAAAPLADSAAPATVVQAQPAAGSCHASGTGPFSQPDPACTPGALNPAVTQATLATTICRSGYSSSIRPSVGITSREKRLSMRAYGDTGAASAYEYDHLVSLELGGAANDARNLWPEPEASPNPKDALEDRLHSDVCKGTIPLATAQHLIATEWIAAYRTYVKG